MFSIADASDIAEELSEPTAEDVRFEGWHLQRLLDGVGEAVVGESEVLEHGDVKSFLDFALRYQATQ